MGNYPVKNVNECRQIASWNKANGAVGYMYRTENHPQSQYKNTCVVRTKNGPKLTNDVYHISGCFDGLDDKCEK
jgi:hypothetical protein